MSATDCRHGCATDPLRDLISRMEDAEVRLVDMAEGHRAGSDQRKRLESKAHGVALARSYVRDALHALVGPT